MSGFGFWKEILEAIRAESAAQLGIATLARAIGASDDHTIGPARLRRDSAFPGSRPDDSRHRKLRYLFKSRIPGAFGAGMRLAMSPAWLCRVPFRSRSKRWRSSYSSPARLRDTSSCSSPNMGRATSTASTFWSFSGRRVRSCRSATSNPGTGRCSTRARSSGSQSRSPFPRARGRATSSSSTGDRSAWHLPAASGWKGRFCTPRRTSAADWSTT